jgi:hypothetical protein
MEIMEMEKSDLHVLHEERLKGKNMELRNSGRKRRRGTWKTRSVLAYCPFLSS